MLLVEFPAQKNTEGNDVRFSIAANHIVKIEEQTDKTVNIYTTCDHSRVRVINLDMSYNEVIQLLRPSYTHFNRYYSYDYDGWFEQHPSLQEPAEEHE